MEEFKIIKSNEFRELIISLISKKDHGTLQKQGYPFPWEGTGISDHVYVFREKYNKVYEFIERDFKKEGLRGYYIDPLSEPYIQMPSLKPVMNTTLGKRSGTIYVGMTLRGDLFINENDNSLPIKFPRALFKMCPYCSNWKFDNDCKCKEYYGIELQDNEIKKFLNTGLENDAIEKGQAWTFDNDYIYHAFYKNNILKIFRKELDEETRKDYNLRFKKQEGKA